MSQITIPSSYQNVLTDGETVLAITEKHKLWVLFWWLNPINLVIGIITLGLAFIYTKHLIKNEVLILTNKRIIGSVNPKLFSKDKIDLMLRSVDNLADDETFFGNMFGWVGMSIETRSGNHEQYMLTKESVRLFKTKLLDVT
jgi:hypothetical protein